MRTLVILFFFTVLGSCGFGTEEPAINGEFLNVKAFGAVGDGKADDTEAFQKAIDFCESKGKKILIIPEGNFFLKNPVIFKRGGVQLLGAGALLREESWFKSIDGKSVTDPFSTCAILIPKNSVGLKFSSSVSDPVRITDIQFKSKEGRRNIGSTTGILFASEYQGPTWPFIIERCHFRGLNFAIKFSSKNQYNVAFVQMRQNSFSQNDECVYFDDTNSTTSVGIRNLAWGFLFENNLCHDNSRVIRGAFSKDEVNIRNNNFEGNIKYINGSDPENIVDLEISNCTVNFEGNHFESIISDAVYISSVFKDAKGDFLPYIGTTAGNSSNKVFLKGNNFDGVNQIKFKPFNLRGLLVYNYDQVQLYLHECDVRLNESNEKNLNMSAIASRYGTSIKIQKGYLDIVNSFISENIDFVSSLSDAKMLDTYSSINAINGIGLTVKNNFKSFHNQKYLGVVLNVKNLEGTGFLGISTKFIVKYKINGKDIVEERWVRGNYGYKLGVSLHFAVIPNDFPSNSTDRSFTAMLEVSKDIIGNKTFQLGRNNILFASDKNIIKLI